MTPAGIESATFRFVAQNLSHCATAVPFFRHWLMRSLRARTHAHTRAHTRTNILLWSSSQLLAVCPYPLRIKYLYQNWKIQTKFTKYEGHVVFRRLETLYFVLTKKFGTSTVRAYLAVSVGSGIFHFTLTTIPKYFQWLVGGRRHTVWTTYILNWIAYRPTPRSPSYTTTFPV